MERDQEQADSPQEELEDEPTPDSGGEGGEGDPGVDSAEGETGSKMSESVPEEISGGENTPLGATDEHSDAPGPHGTGRLKDGES